MPSDVRPGNVCAHEEAVFVEAPARLHFGVLDLRGSLGRWFGGVGAAAPGPTLLVSARPAPGLDVCGEDIARATEFVRRFVGHHELSAGARVCVHRTLPAHMGLGSGTQLALASARALAELHGLSLDAPALARAVGRAQRSAIGTWTFAGGGMVVEGGRRPDSENVAPLLARLPFPSSWRCVVAVPHAMPGASGDAEEEALTQLPPPPQDEVERVAHLALMALLPAVADGDVMAFGRALNAIQTITGRWFAPVQGGTFAPGPSDEIVRRMTEWGVPGIGQSSWGPAVYGIVDGEDAGRRLADRVREAMDGSGLVYAGPFRSHGARVSRAPFSATCQG
jgi:beta-ribofuranosylaminobenzene 5'-phosphate synthase